MSNDIFEGRELDSDNTAKRVPVALCLDTSGSMANDIADLNKAVSSFYDQCKNDEKAKNSVEVIAIEFGYRGVSIASSFDEIENAQIPVFSAGGSTPMGEGVTKALEELDGRKEQYRNEGIDYYQPILVIMTDGGASDSVETPSERARDMVTNKKLTIIPLAFGQDADIPLLESFSPNIQAIRITERFNFLEFFNWLSASAAAMAGGGTPLSTEDLESFMK